MPVKVSDMKFEWMEHATQIRPGAFMPNREEKYLREEARLMDEDDTPFYYQVLAGLGRQLTGWGEHLQARYDRAAQMPLELPTLDRAAK